MSKFNIRVTIPVELNTDALGIDRKTLEDHFQWALLEEMEHRPPFHIEMLHRGLHETLKIAVRNAVEEKEAHKHKGEYIDAANVSDSGRVTMTHTPLWAVTAPGVYKRFRIEKMEDWQLNLEEVRGGPKR